MNCESNTKINDKDEEKFNESTKYNIQYFKDVEQNSKTLDVSNANPNIVSDFINEMSFEHDSDASNNTVNQYNHSKLADNNKDRIGNDKVTKFYDKDSNKNDFIRSNISICTTDNTKQDIHNFNDFKDISNDKTERSNDKTRNEINPNKMVKNLINESISYETSNSDDSVKINNKSFDNDKVKMDNNKNGTKLLDNDISHNKVCLDDDKVISDVKMDDDISGKVKEADGIASVDLNSAIALINR